MTLLRAFLLSTLPLLSLAAAALADSVGQPVPETPLEYLDGATGFKGKPAIVEFWATWCGPCVKMIPHLNEVYAKYKDRGLVIVGVSEDFDKKDIAAFRKKNPINYPVAFDPDNKLSLALKVEVIPYAFIVDKTGKIVWEGLSSAIKDETLESVLK